MSNIGNNFPRWPHDTYDRNNKFGYLGFQVGCYNCNNFGHTTKYCRLIFSTRETQHMPNHHTREQPKLWKKQQANLNVEECNISLQAQNNRSQWCVDRGCSKHMTSDKSTFVSLDQRKGGSVSFGNDNSSKIMGKGTVELSNKNQMAKYVLLIDNMKHNLLSVSQMCDQGNLLTFTSKDCKIWKEGSGKLVATTSTTLNNIYMLDEIKKEKCCLGREDESWLWHRRMRHIHFDNLVKVSKKQVVKDQPEIKKPLNNVYKQCQHGKQTRAEFKKKEHSTTKPLELVHIDICVPTQIKGLNGEEYFVLLFDDFTRMTWVCLIKKKLEALGCFKIFKEQVEKETKLKINFLRSDNGREFTSK